jgi:hypothetical protein
MVNMGLYKEMNSAQAEEELRGADCRQYSSRQGA